MICLVSFVVDPFSPETIFATGRRCSTPCPQKKKSLMSLYLILFFLFEFSEEIARGLKFHFLTPTSVCANDMLNTNLANMNNKVWIMGMSV